MMNENIELNEEQMESVTGGNFGGYGVVKTTGNVNIRKGPGLDYAAIGSVPSGTKLEWTGATGTDERGVKWYKVTRNGKTGWVSSRYAKEM